MAKLKSIIKMNREQKLSKNFDPKILTVSHVGSRGEGVAKLYTEFDYKEQYYNFYIPFSLPNDLILAKPNYLSAEGIRA